MSKANQVCVSLIILGAFMAGMPKAQAQTDQQASVADAARRAREQKKDAAKPATVITNDTLEPEKPAVSPASPTPTGEVGGASINPAAATAGAAAGGQAAPDSAAAPAASETSQSNMPQQAEIKALKQEIAAKQLEVDLAQRALSLANDDFYSRPDFSKDDEGKAKLDAMKSDLTQKQQELDDLKAKLPADAAASDEKPAEGQSQSAPGSSSGPQTPAESQSPAEAPQQKP